MHDCMQKELKRAGTVYRNTRHNRWEMRIIDLIEGVDTMEVNGDIGIEVSSIAYDSRNVGHESLFVAVKGFSVDGNDFIGDAIGKGAAAVVTDRPETRADVPIVLVRDARKAMAVIADRFYSAPQSSMVMTAVTGTNGKTTTAYMVKSVFDEGGMDCGLIGTIRHLVGGEEITSVNTTPESMDIHRYLARMVEAGQSACIMEASSHALALNRVYGIMFRAAAFTNITRDHLDFHGDFNSYLEAKGRLFSDLPGDATAVVNLDDPHAGYIIGVSRGRNIMTYGFDSGCDIHPVSSVMSPVGTECVIETPAGKAEFVLPIPGKFNVSNAMAAIGIGLACGCPLGTVARGLGSMEPVRGRYERIDEGQPFTVIVDYAHTPDALDRILASAREITAGRLISVFGCGGDRDRGKRPEMGEISARLADFTIVTSDNPRTEEPDAIIDDIVKGIPHMIKYEAIVAREEGIRKALESAGAGDTVVVAGKGHEDYQIIGRKKYHFDDAESVRRLLKAMEWKTTHCKH